MKKLMRNLFMVTLAACMLGGCQTQNNKASGEEMKGYFYNPLDINYGIGDPWLYRHSDGYYYYTHSMTGVVKVTKTKSPTLLRENDGDEARTKVIFRQKSINVVEIWAPEVFFFEGRWYCYFTATDAALPDAASKDAGRRIYGMKSKTEDIFGEWETAVKIALPDDTRSIDATFFAYNGHQYIVYAGWKNKYNDQYIQNLYINELETGNPLKVAASETSRHLISEPDREWEQIGAKQNEGPAMSFAPDGTPVLLYSGAYSGADYYCIGYLKLVGSDLLNQNSWQKGDKPLMETDVNVSVNPEASEIIAPGHNSVFKSPDGKEDWICYHSAKYSGAGWDRQVRLQKMTWNGNTPVVEKIFRASDPAPLPSGDTAKRYKFEAEFATLTSDCFAIDQEGYASNDRSVSINDNGTIRFDVAVPENGQYAVGVRYSNRDKVTDKITLKINGREEEIVAPKTLYDDTFFVSWIFTDLYIKASGPNAIEVQADSSILIDCLLIDYLDHNA